MKTKVRFIILSLFILVSIGAIFISRGVSVEKIMVGTLARPFYTLTVTKSGAGTGTVTSALGEINCGSICTAQILSGTIVVLTATPDAGNTFNGWSGGGCAGTGTCSVEMDGNKIVDANFINTVPIPLTSLYAWFKYDEGAGTVIIDYSPVGVNGALQVAFGNPVPKFWSVPTFGHNDAGAPLTWVLGIGRPVVSTKYVSMVGFIKPKGVDPGPWTLAGAAMWHGQGGAINWMKLGWSMAGPPKWAMDCSNIAWVQTAVPATINTWHFVYMYSDTVANITQLYLRLSGGPLTLIASAPHTAHNNGNSTAVLAFGANNTNYPMDAGDMLWWAAADASGIIGIAQANNVYENLKVRYGML